MKRLFAFGCSFTGGCLYTTWADHLSNHFDFYENWALAGIGNRGIFNRLNEAILKRNITKDDTVVIIWSSPIREDRILTNAHSWAACGSIYNQSTYSPDWVEKYFNPFMGLMETVNYVHAAQHILENIDCEWTMGWMISPDQTNFKSEFVQNKNSFLKLCDPKNLLVDSVIKINSHLKMIDVDMEDYIHFCRETYNTPEMLSLLNGVTAYKDSHPDPLSHYYFAKDKIAPKLGLTNFDPDNKIKDLAQEWATFMSILPRGNSPARINFKESTHRFPRDTF